MRNSARPTTQNFDLGLRGIGFEVPCASRRTLSEALPHLVEMIAALSRRRRRATQSQVVGVYHPFLSVRLAEHTPPAFQHVHRNLFAAWVLAALRMHIEHASPLVNAAEHRSTTKVAEVAPHPAACHTAERTRQWLNSLHA